MGAFFHDSKAIQALNGKIIEDIDTEQFVKKRYMLIFNFQKTDLTLINVRFSSLAPA